jgi:hypothetical protein
MRCYATIRRIERDYMQPVAQLDSVCGIWVWGDSGSGKTRAVLSMWPDAFPKPRNIWWDGYQGEEVALLDDVDCFDVKLGGVIKHWADFAPFIGQVKGGSIKIRPKRLVVTSQYQIEDIWSDKETREALLRRFKVVKKIVNFNIDFNSLLNIE